MDKEPLLNPRSIRITLAIAAVLALMIAVVAKLTEQKGAVACVASRTVLRQTPPPVRAPAVLEALPEPVQRLIHPSGGGGAGGPEMTGAAALPQDEQPSLWRALTCARYAIHPMTGEWQPAPGDALAAHMVPTSPRLRRSFASPAPSNGHPLMGC